MHDEAVVVNMPPVSLEATVGGFFVFGKGGGAGGWKFHGTLPGNL